MSDDSGRPPQPRAVVDYDSGFEYGKFWDNRDYERWVENRLLARLLPHLPHGAWFADFGGGFGRNAPHYPRGATRTLLIDYSVHNLEQAAEHLAEPLAQGRVYLLRSDLVQLPLVDRAVASAMVVRVLHHLTDARSAISEMARVVGQAWLLDVPIKHHLLARLRSPGRAARAELRSPEPRVAGSTEYPFSTFQLAWVRAQLRAADFETQVLASGNNFRRWDQVVPRSIIPWLRPVVYPSELALQRLGRGWWGPSQFLLARRRGSAAAPAHPVHPGGAGPGGVASIVCCPRCRGELEWAEAAASCKPCAVSFPRRGPFWDFVEPV
ncbi:MAG: methyltransferase domain-containing protein [Candidatus Dormibacteria bacterium]